jgi:hypothetical protein
MKVLTPIADLLVQQPWGEGTAAPCFNMYPPQEDKAGSVSPQPVDLHKKLIQEAEEASKACPAEAPQDVKDNVASIVASINELTK